MPASTAAISLSTSWSATFITRLHRYKSLFLRRWWIPVLTICLGLFVEAFLIYQTPPSYQSTSKMMMAGKLNIAQGAVYSEDAVNFYGTQIQLMQSAEVRRSAESLVRSAHPELQPVTVEIFVIQKPRTSIFDLSAIGSAPDYTQAYLNAVMQKYLDFKRGMREGRGHEVTTGITEQLVQVEKDLRPSHTKIIKRNDEITKQDKLIEHFRADSLEKLKTRRESIGKQMENLQANVKEWEAKALDLSQRLAQFNRIKGKVDRLKTLYDRLTNNLKEIDVSQVVGGEDQVSIMEMATAPISVRPGLIKSLLIGFGIGALAGLAILILLDRIDDRMASFSEFQHHFSENVLGQIPKEKTKGKVDLLQPDDARHVFAESYRNIRSSIFFMPYEGPRPKSFLVTSAVPSEGKSTVSANLAITMALSGARTLLIDCDLRRGALREAFGIPSKIGFSEVLKQEVNWREVVVPTACETLFVLPRGKTLSQPSEHLLRESTEALLKEIYQYYDYVIIDSSPVLAADDTTSLAPKIDATLFVVRLSYTSARLTKKGLELLYGRQVNVPGVILNFVDTSLPEYYYYQYSEYYSTPAVPASEAVTPVGREHPKPIETA